MLAFDAELITYASIFGIGLFLGVYAMLHGSVRMSQRDPASLTPPPAAFNTPVISAALIAFGAVGYLTVKYYRLDTIYVIIWALIAAAVAWLGMTVLMAQWALKGPIVDPNEELEELQGTVAVVTDDITPESLGAISYTFRGKPAAARARSIHGEGVAAGTEVVIEKIENEIADVELWSLVEQRL